MHRHILTAAALSASLFLAACGASASADDAADDAVTGPSAGMCAPEMPDCVDTVTDPASSDLDPRDSEFSRENARGLLGVAEENLPADVRIGRRGEEHLMLTEDYVIGRMTVALDPDADGTFRVTAVTVELEGGPETIEG